MSRQQQDAARIRTMLRALDQHDPATEKWVETGIGRLHAMAHHPAGMAIAKLGPSETDHRRECTPPAWTPAPDPAHSAPNHSILRGLWSLIRKAARP